MRTKLWLAAVPLVLSGCGDMLFAELDVPETCVTFADQKMIAAPIAAEGVLPWEGSFPIPSGLPDVPSTDLQAQLLRAELTAKSGISDFTFAKELSATVLPPADSELPEVTVASFKPTPADATKVPAIVPLADIDVAPYFKDGGIHTRLSFSGTLPTNEWTLDIKLCAHVRARTQYLELVQSSMEQ